ncbi:MAG: hypothetical protein JSW50_16030 [Candidatus Latescibacterota bacterium]|nr:MAG: hypothetical protein JSW50_16030 [Candidatus Latescibacterota bacterium]
MSTLRTLKIFALATLAVWLVGCSDDTTKPPPPPQPPQLVYSTVKNLPNNDVYDIFVDSKGRQWFCTDSGVGMALKNNATFVETRYNSFDGVPNIKCRATAELNGKIFIGTWGGGIGVGDSLAINYPNSGEPDPNRPDSTLWQVLNEEDGLIANRVFSLAVDDSSVWIATAAGVSQYIDDDSRPMEDRWIDHSDLGPNVVTQILVAKTRTRGTEVWMAEKLRDEGGTLVPGGIRVRGFPGYQHYTTESSGIPSDNCNGITYDSINDLFLSAHATHGAATVDVDTRVWNYFNKASGAVSDLGSSIGINLRDTYWPQGTRWFATQAGLSRVLPDGTITNYVQGSGMPSINVRKVYIDPGDHVWLAFVEAGAVRVKP